MTQQPSRRDLAARLRRRIEHEARLRLSMERILDGLLDSHGLAPPVTSFAPELPRLGGGGVEAVAQGDGAPDRPGPADPVAGWPERRLADPPAMRPPPGHQCYSLADSEVPVIGVMVLGLELAALAEAVEMVAEAQKREGSFIPIFVTDRVAFEVFRRHGYVAEIIGAEGAGGSVPAAERLDLLRRQWGIDRFVRLGPLGAGLVGEDRDELADGMLPA